MNVDAIILAGGRTNNKLRRYSKAEHEALIKIADTPMVEYVIKAARSSKYINNLAIVGPAEEIKKSVSEKIDIIVNSTYTLLDNIKRGLEILNNDDYVLIITSDIPLITDEIIDDFIQSCMNKDADIFYPIVSKKVNKMSYPGVKRTYVHLVEGTFTGGNIMLIKPAVLYNTLDLLNKVIIWRKKPWRLSQLLGFKFVFKFIFGTLTLSEIEDRVAKLTGYKGMGMISRHPEIGFDVDKPKDLIMMREKYIF